MSSSHHWHPIPSSPSRRTCKVHLLQAGGLYIPKSYVLLPAADTPLDNPNSEPSSQKIYAPDYCFLITHPSSPSHPFLFDLGMRPDLSSLPPFLLKNVLPAYDCEPLSPASILSSHGTAAQQPASIKAVIFSHMHFDHIGAGAGPGTEYTSAEVWVGPTCCTYARPGYPVDEGAPTLSETLPVDGSRVIREMWVSDEEFARTGDGRRGKVEQGKSEGKYEGVKLWDPRAESGDRKGWIALGAFERAFDVFGDGSAYLVDAPGHSAGHQMMLLRVRIGNEGEDDDFVFLAGDCYHHPDLLKEPRRMARPPYGKECMHAEPKIAVDMISRTKTIAEKDNVWVLGAHDSSVGEAIAPGVKVIEGLVEVNGWRGKGWKKGF